MSASPESSWPVAARLVARWLERRERIDALLETLPRTLGGPERARCQHLVLGVVRHFSRIEASLTRLVAHPPRFSTRAVLFVAGYELIEAAADAGAAASGRVAKIVHHAVEQTKALSSPAEAKLVNAVVRKLAPLMAEPAPLATADAAALAEYFSHPEWLVRSWLAQFGAESTRALLEWNQQPAPIYARWRGPGSAGIPAGPDGLPAEGGPHADSPDRQAGTPAATLAPPNFLQPTQWAGFYTLTPGHWAQVEPLLKAGTIYLQDPSTRLPVDLLEPRAGEAILDLCAAPGGKALLIADTMKTGRLVAVDLPVSMEAPGARIDRLKENLSHARAVEVALVQSDVLGGLAGALREHKLPATYPGVLLDVPCSNTGVMRHRVDVKWRLQPGDFKKHPQQQLSMLHAAARFVAGPSSSSGRTGRLVYSTCSIDAEENEHVVRAFLASKAGGPFELEKTILSYPWTSGHDGGAAFLLRKKA
jgi:16S rRNA (cytosine967-C5)-methyltransferase